MVVGKSKTYGAKLMYRLHWRQFYGQKKTNSMTVLYDNKFIIDYLCLHYLCLHYLQKVKLSLVTASLPREG